MAKKLAQVAEVTNPMFLSLVKNPANRTGFKIIRSGGQEVDKKEKGKFKAKRSRRMDSKDGMLYIELPTKFTEAEALAVMESFGLEEDYELSMTDEYVRLIRSDMIAVEMPETIAIRLDDTSTAHVTTTSFAHTNAARSDNIIGGAVLEGIDFEGHSDRDVEKFLEEKNIDIKEADIEKIDDETFHATYRSDGNSAEGLRTDRVKLADGVTARIYRSSSNDLPESIQRMVVEEAYGSYGYGQLDFFASLTDQMYTDAAYDAADTLRTILADITIYSGLNLTARIDLMNNALSQYGFYMAELMNSLPRSVVSVMTSDISKNSTREDQKMAIESKKEDITTEDTKRSDNVVEDSTDEKKADEAITEESKEAEAARSDSDENDKEDVAPAEDLLKRSDVQAMIDTAVSAAIAAVRKDEEKEVEPKAEKAEDSKEETGDTDAKRDDAMVKLAASVEALASKVEEFGDTSTVRSANTSAASTEDTSVFKGTIFGSK